MPPRAQGLIDRGFMRLEPADRPPRLYFTGKGLAALRAMMADARLARPEKFAHIRQELGIDPAPNAQAGGPGDPPPRVNA